MALDHIFQVIVLVLKLRALVLFLKYKILLFKRPVKLK